MQTKMSLYLSMCTHRYTYKVGAVFYEKFDRDILLDWKVMVLEIDTYITLKTGINVNSSRLFLLMRTEYFQIER